MKQWGCCQYQYFKDRKQITTEIRTVCVTDRLLSISVFQRSKANHNKPLMMVFAMTLLSISVFQRSKANHNNQLEGSSMEKLLSISVFQRSKANHNLWWRARWPCFVVVNISISKIESKSQHIGERLNRVISCCQYQYFKDRKQITTHWE